MHDTYQPTKRFENQNLLYGNHFRFNMEALPDLSFYAQDCTVPMLSVPPAKTPNPFTVIPQVGDHIEFGTFEVVFLVDAQFKTYFSLYYWLRGYAFPHSYDDLQGFARFRRQQLGNPHPAQPDIFKTHGVVLLLKPDTDTTLAEIEFTDIFPTALSGFRLTTTASEPPQVSVTATFAYTTFDIHLA